MDGGRPNGRRTYAAPPPDFDVHTASERELLRHGLPRRPDPETEPALARVWKRVLAQPLIFVEAEVPDDLVAPRREHAPFIPSGGLTTWAGVRRLVQKRTRGSDFSEVATMAFGTLIVPHVLAVHPADQEWNVGFWIGLTDTSQTQILQAGFSADLATAGFLGLGGGDVSWYAWTEWWLANPPDDDSLERSRAKPVTNFPVASGDTIFVLVCQPEAGFGQITLANLSRGVATTIGVPEPSSDPAAPRFLGETVAWAVEKPAESPGLPYFTPVTFYDCHGGSAHELFQLKPGGVTSEITVSSISSPWGSPITRTYYASPSSFMVFWEGFGERF